MMDANFAVGYILGIATLIIVARLDMPPSKVFQLVIREIRELLKTKPTAGAINAAGIISLFLMFLVMQLFPSAPSPSITNCTESVAWNYAATLGIIIMLPAFGAFSVWTVSHYTNRNNK